MKIRKFIGISLLVFLLAAGLLSVWWLSSGENWVKGKVEASVSELTGRTFSIDGEFSVDLSANPVVTAEAIHLSNPPWALNPDLVRLDKLEVSIELASVFSEPVKINFINLEGLVIALEEQASGEKSWQVLSTRKQAAAPVDEPPAELPVRVGRIKLVDFSLLHEAPKRTVPLDFHLGQLEVTQGADQQLQFTSNGRFGGEPFALAGNLGPLNELASRGKISHDIRLDLGEITLQSSGSIKQLSTFSGANIDLVFSGPEFEWLLTQLALPQFSHGDFNFNLNVRTEADQTFLDIDGDLGSLQANAKGDFDGLANIDTANLIAEISGDDLGGLLEVFGVTGILRKPFSLKADIGRATRLYQVQTLEVETGGNSLTVSGQMGDWPKLENTNLDFSLLGSDLSAWAPILKMDNLPASAFSLDGGISPTDSGLKLERVNLKLGGAHISADGITGEAPEFTGTALNVEATGPSLAEFSFLPGLEKAPALPFHIKGNVGKDATGLTFDNMNLTLGENSLQLGGRLGLNDQFAGSYFTTSVLIPNLAGLGPMLGQEGLPDQRLSVNGNYQRTPDGWAFQLSNGKFANASFESQGKYIDVAAGLQIEATSQVTAPDLAVLAHVAGVENVEDLPGLPVSIEGFARYDAGKIELKDVQAKLGELHASADGVIGNLADMSATDFQFAMTSPSLKTIGELFDYPLLDEPFDLKARFEGSPSAFHAGQLEVSLGPSDLSGEVSVDLTGKPRVNGVLFSNRLDLTWLQRKDEGVGAEQKPVKAGKSDFLIPDTPIRYSREDLADLDLDITISSLGLPKWSASDVHTHTRIVNGGLFVDSFHLRGADGGLLGGNLSVAREADSDVTSIALSVEGHGVKLGIIGAAEGRDPDTIRESEIVANISGAGVTYRDLAQSLNGRIEVVQGPGLTEAAGFSLIFGDFVGELLSMLNPFTKTEKFIKNECAVGIVNVESGVLTLDPIVSQTDKMTLVAKGVVDLHTEKIQFTFETKLRKGIGVSASMVINPFIGITGTLASPEVGLDPAALAVKGTVAVATVGMSLLARSLTDRYFSSKDPCGDALKKDRAATESAQKKDK